MDALHRRPIPPAPRRTPPSWRNGPPAAGPRRKHTASSRALRSAAPARRRRRVLRQQPGDPFAHRTLERQPPGQQFIEDHAEAVEVRLRPDLVHPTHGLLRRHVGGRAHDLAGQCGPHVVAAGQAEVHDDRLAASRDEDVGRLQIAVNDALGVGLVQREGQPADEVGGLHARQWRRKGDGQRPALDVGHRQERRAVELAGVVDGAEVGVAEAGGAAALLSEAVGQALRRTHRAAP